MATIGEAAERALRHLGIGYRADADGCGGLVWLLPSVGGEVHFRADESRRHALIYSVICRARTDRLLDVALHLLQVNERYRGVAFMIWGDCVVVRGELYALSLWETLIASLVKRIEEALQPEREAICAIAEGKACAASTARSFLELSQLQEEAMRHGG